MRPTEHSDADIISAGKKLSSQGKNVTGAALRQQLNGGSPTRLRNVWDAHLRETKGEAAGPPVELPFEVEENLKQLQDNLGAELRKLVTACHFISHNMAEKRTSEANALREAERNQHLAEMKDSDDEIERTSEKLELAQDLNTKLTEDLGVRDATIRQLERKLAESAARIGSQDERVRELSTLNTTLKATVSEHVTTIGELNSLNAVAIDRADRATTENKALAKQVSEQAVALASSGDKLKTLEKSLARTEADLLNANTALGAVTDNMNSQGREIIRLQEKIESAKSEHISDVAKLDMMRTDSMRANETVRDLRRYIQKLEGKTTDN